MTKMKRFLIAVSLLLVLGACAQPDLNLLTQQFTNTEIYFSDSFDQTSSNWHTYTEPGASVLIQDGVFKFNITEANFDFWTTHQQKYKNIQVEVDAAKMEGPDSNDYGLICRYQDQQNFYAFLISSDGYYGILRVKDGKYELISQSEMQASDAIKTGNGINHLRADCLGSQLVFYANGTFLTTVEDSAFPEGQVGLLAGTYDEAGLTINFDNFAARRPELLK